MQEGTRIRAEWRQAWPVVLGTTIGYGAGGAMVQLVAGLFIVPMREDLHWSTTAVTIAPIVTFIWALCSPFTGGLVDRLGGRRAALIGTLGVGLATGLLAVAPVSYPVLFALAAVIGIFSSLTSTFVYARIVATWFPKGVGLPMGITLSGSALVALFSLPVVSAAIRSGGWRHGFVAAAAIILLVGLPVIFLACRERIGGTAEGAREEKPIAGATVAEALRSPVFWWYIASFSLGCLPLGGFIAHLQPLLRGQLGSVDRAVQLGMVYAISITFGRVVGGLMLDRAWPFAVGATLLLLAAAGAFAIPYLQAGAPFALAAAIVWLVGMGQGAEADYVTYFNLRTFGMRAFGSIVGIMAVPATIALTMGGLLYSRLFDAYGDYLVACSIGGACWAASAILLLAAGWHERRSAPLAQL